MHWDPENCTFRVHCPVCRTDAAWRARVGAPDVCRWGVTTDNLPPPPEPTARSGRRAAFGRPGGCRGCGDEKNVADEQLRLAAEHTAQSNTEARP